jgi:uncharacterized protein YcbK (DUF882 family)
VRARIVGLALLAASVPAAARVDAAPPAVAKKQALLAAKQEAAATPDLASRRAAQSKALARRVGKPPEAVLNLRNSWTDEVLTLPATGDAPVAREVVDRFLRCHFTNEPTEMDARLIGVVVQAARHFKVGRVDVVSGFRAPKYNLALRKKGRAVARDSQHTKGNAIDFRLPGVPVAKLQAWAIKLKLGGVGFYPQSKFVHIDTGPVRRWNGE